MFLLQRTEFTKPVIDLLKENRDAIRKEVIDAENSLQNESPDEIFAYTLPEELAMVYMPKNQLLT